MMNSSPSKCIKSILLRELIEKLTKRGSRWANNDDSIDFFQAFGQKVLIQPTPHSQTPCTDEALCAELQGNARDLDLIAVKRLVRRFNTTVSLRRKTELLEFLRQMLSAKNASQNGLGQLRHAGLELSSSGFYSDASGRVGVGLTSSTDSSLHKSNPTIPAVGELQKAQLSLWGQPIQQAPKRRLPVSSGFGTSGSASSMPPPSPSRQSDSSMFKRTQRMPNKAGQSGPSVSENDLIEELLFALNSSSGTIIKWDPLADAFKVSPDVCVPAGNQDTVLVIAECGWLRLQISQVVSRFQHDQSVGVLARSLASGLHEQLTEYYRLIATLESQFKRDVRNSTLEMEAQPPSETPFSFGQTRNTDGSLDAERQSTTASSSQPLTLTRLLLWTQEPRHRLTFLASLCEAGRDRRGGALASIVYGYTQHGDQELALLARHLLVKLAASLLQLISQWIYDGQLDDPAQEFFVACHPAVKLERLWHERYSLRRHMLPDFITSSQASKILLAGKSVNFLQHVCGEKQGIKDREIIQSTRLKHVESMFEQELDNSFDLMISTVYKQTSHYLLETLIKRYHFLDHLRATRQFLLLGQGDFIQHFMDLLDEDLSRLATSLLRHHLTSALETAIRDTNAQYEQPEILQRLDVRLLDISLDETGWDVFSLDYRVDGPLATVFTEDCMLMYLRAFNFLWRAKRMEFTLSSLWKHQLIAGRLGQGLNVDLGPVLHLAELLGAEIRFFIQQLQYYVNFEVLECAWEVLVKQIHAATDLDQVIEAHQAFLSGVIVRCLLDAASRQLIGQLRTIFDLILDFSQIHHEFNSVALQELRSREGYAAAATACTKAGKWSTDSVQESQEKLRRAQFLQKNVGPFQARIRILASSYHDMLGKFIQALCDHPDPSLRLLSDHLNFNGYYQQQQQQQPANVLINSKTTSGLGGVEGPGEEPQVVSRTGGPAVSRGPTSGRSTPCLGKLRSGAGAGHVSTASSSSSLSSTTSARNSTTRRLRHSQSGTAGGQAQR